MQDMGVKVSATEKALDDFMLKAMEIITKKLLDAMSKLGEECVARIRDRSQQESWIDHTSNLRSSIGYAVYERGRKYIQSSFPVLSLGDKGSGDEGHAEGIRMVNELAQQYSNTFALVVVAAMNYAEYVEAIESKDVLESTRIWAESEISVRLERAKEEAMKVINSMQL